MEPQPKPRQEKLTANPPCLSIKQNIDQKYLHFINLNFNISRFMDFSMQSIPSAGMACPLAATLATRGQTGL
jgi:hypothetical protein